MVSFMECVQKRGCWEKYMYTQCLKIDQNVSFKFFFNFGHFPPIFVLLKVICQVTLFDSKLHVLKMRLFL